MGLALRHHVLFVERGEIDLWRGGLFHCGARIGRGRGVDRRVHGEVHLGVAAFWEGREAIARERGGHLVRVHGGAEWSDCARDSGVVMAFVTRWSLTNEVNQLRRR